MRRGDGGVQVSCPPGLSTAETSAKTIIKPCFSLRWAPPPHSAPSHPCPSTHQRVSEQPSPRAVPSPDILLTSRGKGPSAPPTPRQPVPRDSPHRVKGSPVPRPPPQAWARPEGPGGHRASDRNPLQAPSASSGQGTSRHPPDPSPVRTGCRRHGGAWAQPTPRSARRHRRVTALPVATGRSQRVQPAPLPAA